MSDFSNRRGGSGDPFYWLIAFALLFTGVAAPVGIIMIALRLMSRNRPRGRHPYYAQSGSGQQAGARTTAAPSGTAQDGGASPSGKAGPGNLVARLLKSGRSMVQTGVILTGIFGGITLIDAVDNLWILPDILWYLEELIPLLCFLSAGLSLLIAGLRKTRKAKRYRNYLAMIGERPCVSLSALAASTGLSPSRVRGDLEDMLDDGLFPAGYLDHAGGLLILSPEGARQASQANEEPKDDTDVENAILAEIRAVSDAVRNQKLSGQIDRIGSITAKILDYQKSHPENSPQLHSFLSYYLPTTLKILRAYSQLEAQEVSGEHITAAMERIEGMMDKVVEGFETQLDLLFRGDAMDITADVEVLERMLAKDGLSDQEGLTLNL